MFYCTNEISLRVCLEGLVILMNEVRLKNDLGHPLCDNIRNGNWLCGYITTRLQAQPGTKEVHSFPAIVNCH